MSRTLTPEHLAAMRAGRERHEEEERERKAARQEAYSAWVREDARLYRAVVQALALGDRAAHATARDTYRANLRRMPPLP